MWFLDIIMLFENSNLLLLLSLFVVAITFVLQVFIFWKEQRNENNYLLCAHIYLPLLTLLICFSRCKFPSGIVPLS